MQRIDALIEKLRTQFRNKADLSQLLLTAQMIQREISGEMRETVVLGSENVAVLVPAGAGFNKPYKVEGLNGSQKEYYELDTGLQEVDEVELRLLELEHQAGLYTGIAQKVLSKDEDDVISDKKLSVNRLYTISDVPTLYCYLREDDDRKVLSREEDTEKSNDKPRSTLPIRELVTDIPEVDRFRLIKNLFRGDEVMYERCIKTIDNFNSLEEAEFWVTRELKTKIGWVQNEDVEYFDQLIRRRFD